MENKESQKTTYNHEVLHSTLPYRSSSETISYEEFQRILNGRKKPSIRERASIIHPPEIEEPHSGYISIITGKPIDGNRDNLGASEVERDYLQAIGGKEYFGMSKGEFKQEVDRVFGFSQNVNTKKPKKTLASKLQEKFNDPKFVKNAQKALYTAHGLAFTLGSIAAVNGYDSGNKSLLQFGLTTGLLSAFGLYATYKFAKASSDVCKPLLN